MKLTPEKIAQYAYKAGFRNNALITAVAIALAESDGNTVAQGYNSPSKECPHGSNDQGLWQINDCYHSEVSPGCACDAECSAAAVYRISNNGTYFVPWSTYNSGAYKKFIDVATKAAGMAHNAHKPSTQKRGLFHRELGHWQYLSQLTMPQTAGYPPINRENDCGPACLSMLLLHLFNIYLSDDMINVLEAGPNHTGYTSNEEMINYLHSAWQIATEMRVPRSISDAYYYTKQQLARSYAVINLGNVHTDSAILHHYTVATGIKSGRVIIADPGVGKRIVVSKTEYFDRSYIAQLCPMKVRS